MENIRLTNISVNSQRRPALQIQGGYLDLPLAMTDPLSSASLAPLPNADLPLTILDVLINQTARQWLFRFAEDYGGSKQELEKWSRLTFSQEEIKVLPPVHRPAKVLCVGLNYPGVDSASGSPDYPVLFHKVATSIIGDGDKIIRPRDTQGLTYEGELTVVIGRRGKRIPRQDSHQYIAGYTIANDVGAPEIQARSSQWTSGKMIDTFCPLGPNLVPAEAIPDPSGLTIQTHLNQELVQKAPVSDMLFDIPFLIEYISSLVTLEPGDLVLTGSPKKVGHRPDPSKLMVDGDTVSVSIEPIGTLSNSIISEE